ncbi:MBL fold metallo-hydrolase [Acanthopleuribacter pedis]|uniref:MBL fold metallo-hydrolase n=1 Tax=Acanthopleuribacter pedis TaxID=442870 RepID=A0A8J7QJP1_9BACT|nr:MBL fold metallo-hydrolase [Acanthopleuribacter pedis]MBO1322121.1 MBL fold metallo-hydrolase [Acanthopleuribacter pedis]
MKKKIGIAFLVLTASFGVFFAVVSQPLAIPEQSTFTVDWARVRQLATADEQPLPTGLNALLTAYNEIPSLVVTGDFRFSGHPLPIYAYQIVYPDQTLVIDPVVDHDTAVAILPTAKGFPEAFGQMQSAMRAARHIALTHEHFDHSAGIPNSPYLAEILPKLVLTREQLENDHEMEMATFSPELRAKIQPLDYEDYHRLAPGVVLIKTGGHTPGSQMVYIQRADGREFLLIGDLAWHADNYRRPQGHPRFVHWVGREDGEKMAHILRFLHDLQTAQPEMNLVVAHDGDQMAAYVAAGLIGEHFH